MGHVHTTTQVDGPTEAAFEFGVNPERVAEWFAMVVEVKDVSGPLDTVGAGYTAVMKIAGRKLDARWEVARVEKPRLLELKGATPGGGTATFTMQYAQVADGTEITVDCEYELPGGFVGGVADKLFVERAVEREFKHSMENFKAIVEAEVPVQA
jgi:coenzyme Q-binding protein COQ10